MANESKESKGLVSEEKAETKAVSDVVSKMRKNPWMASTIILVILLLIVVIFFRGGTTGKVVSSRAAAENLISFLRDQNGVDTTFVSSERESNLYKVTLSSSGKTMVAYVTLDGQYGSPSLIPLTATTTGSTSQQNTAPTEVPKTDKPAAELYIFSYCPAGTAALSSFAEMAKTMSSAADLRVKFFSNMHGEHEKQQNMIQECIQDVAKAKYWDYAAKFVTDIYPVCGATRDIACDKNESIKLMKSLGIDSTAVMSCVSTKGSQYYASEQADAAKLQLQYSPSVVINGVYLENADRTPNGLKSAVCSAFNTVPSACAGNLSTTAAASSGSCS